MCCFDFDVYSCSVSRSQFRRDVSWWCCHHGNSNCLALSWPTCWWAETNQRDSGKSVTSTWPRRKASCSGASHQRWRLLYLLVARRTSSTPLSVATWTSQKHNRDRLYAAVWHNSTYHHQEFRLVQRQLPSVCHVLWQHGWYEQLCCLIHCTFDVLQWTSANKYKKLSCCRQTARCFLSLNISLNRSMLLKVIWNDALV